MSMKALTIILILICVTACNSPNISGPCVHTYEDPVIHIDQVTDVVTGTSINAFQITSALIDTFNLDVASLRISVSYNVVVFDSVLICNTPCGFGTSGGIYTLSISAPNYKDTTVVIQANYAVFNGGCPSSNSGGTVFNFQLSPK